MNQKSSIVKRLFGVRSWRSSLKLLVALALPGWCALAQAQQSDVWAGLTGNYDWSYTNDWSVGGSLTTGMSTNGDDVTFPPLNGISSRSTNDFAANSLAINSITFSTNNYIIGGNSLIISNGITDSFGSNTIVVPVVLGQSQTFQNTFSPVVGTTNSQTTEAGTVNLNSYNLTIGGGGNYFLNGIVSSGTNGGGTLTVNDVGGIARLGPSSGSAGNTFGSNYLYITSSPIPYATNIIAQATNIIAQATNVVVGSTNIVLTGIDYELIAGQGYTNYVYATNAVATTTNIVLAATNIINAATNYVIFQYSTNMNFWTNYVYLTTNNFSTNVSWAYLSNSIVTAVSNIMYVTNLTTTLRDVVTVSAGTLQMGTTAAPFPSGANVGNVWVDGTWDLNGDSVTINGLEDSGAFSGVIDNVAPNLTGVYTLTVGNANSNGIFSGTIQNSSGTVALTKTGYGTETLIGGNTYSGPTTVGQGTLAIKGSGTLGSASPVLTIASGAVLDVSGVAGGYYPYVGLTLAAGTPTKPYTNLFGSYYPYYPNTTNFVVTITTNNVTVDTNTTITWTGSAYTTNVTYSMTNSYSYSYSTNSIASIVNNDVVGDFVVTGGGAISPITSIAPGIATWSIGGNLSIDASVTPSPNRVNFLLGTNTTPGGGTNDLITVGTNLYIGDELDFVITPLYGSLASGKYTLIESANYIPHGNSAIDGNSDAANLVLIAPRGIAGTFDTSSQPGDILLQASGTANPGSIIWAATSAANDTWNVALTQNWRTNGNTTPSAQYYFSEDNVTFDDTGFGTVTLPVVQSPGSVTFNNNLTNYSFNANNATFIAGPGGVTLNGSGTVTFNNPNAYTGPTTINNGTLIMGNYGQYNSLNLYNGVNPGLLVFGGIGNNEIFEQNSGQANVSQLNVFNGFTLNPGANAQFATVGRGANNISMMSVGPNITRNVGSSLYVNMLNEVKSGTANNGLYITNTLLWTNGLVFAGWAHVGTDWYLAQTNFGGASAASYSYTGYSNGAAFTASVWVPTNNISMTNGTPTVTAGSTIYTLKLAGSSKVTINSGVTLTDATGGLLISSASTGPNTILGGTLMGASGADLIVLQNYTASPFTIGSVIADNGSATALTLGGLGGTLILTNNETYSGATYINGSTLQVGNGTPLGSIASSSAIYDNGTLSFNRPDAATVNGAVSGSGSLTQLGTGSLTLTANNTLSGLVTVSTGTLQLGNGGAAGSVSNSIGLVDNSILVFDNSGTVSFPNTISGSGIVVNSGTGTFAVTTNETYTGITVVSNGTIQVASSGTISNTAAIVVNAGGLLDVTANGLTLRSAVPSEILAGNGSISGTVTTTPGSLITPGTNGVFGTLTFNGALNLNAGKYYFDVTNNANDQILVGGIVNQGGGVAIINCATNLANGIYNLIYATNGVSGSAASIAVYAPLLPAGQLGVITNATSHTVDLLVFSGYPTTVTWVGDGGNNYWDTGAGSHWQSGGSPIQYSSADDVIFDDSGNGAVPVNIDVGSVYPNTVTVNSTNVNYTLGSGSNPANIISGGAEVIKNGPGTLTIQNVGDYLGGTLINGGTLQLGNNTSVGADGMIGSSFVTNNGVLIADNFTNETVFGPIAGNGSLLQQGNGKLTLAGNNSAFAGPITIATNSALQVGNAVSGNLGTAVVTNNGTLIFDVSQTVGVNIAGLGSVSNVFGTVLLGGTNTYAGSTAVNGGELDIASTNALPTTTSLILNDNSSGVANSAGILDMHGNDLTVASISGGGTGAGTANLEEGLIYNNDAVTTNFLIINGGTTNTYNGQILDNVNAGTSKLGLVLMGGQLNLVNPVNAAGAWPFPNTFSGGIIVSNAGLGVGAATSGNSGVNSAGGSPVGTQNIVFTGTNDVFYSAGSGGSTTPTVQTTVGTVSVSNSATLWILGPQRGQVNFTTLLGGGTVVYQGVYVRDHFSFGVTTNFTGTIIFAGNANGTGGMADDSGTGFPNANVVFGITNITTAGIDDTVGGNVLPFGSLSGGDNTALLSSTYANGGVNTIYAIGGLNTSTTFGGQITDGGTGLRKVGTGTLTLTNNVLSYGGQTCVSNGILAYAPLGNSRFNPFTPLTNNYFVSSNYTIVSPGILDVSQAGGTLYLGTNTFSQSLFGDGTLNGSLWAGSNCLIAPAWRVSSGGTWLGNLTITNNATLNAGTTFQMQVTTNGLNDSFTVGGTLTINRARLTIVTNGITFANLSSNVFHLFYSPAGVPMHVTAPVIGAVNTTGITNITLPAVANSYWVTNLALDGSMALVNTNNPLSTNDFLSGLVVTPAGALSPAFSANTYTYTAVEAYLNSPITVTPTNADTTATNKVIYLGVTNGLASGVASGSLALNANPLVLNTITVKVTAQDGLHITNYTVNVTRNPDRTPGSLAPIYNGSTITMSWPLSENGYQLQAQTNVLGTGLSTNWVVVAGSTLTNTIVIPVVATNPSVFYRLINTNTP